jgi:zinc transporter
MVDEEEEKLDTDERYTPEHGSCFADPSPGGGLKRFLAPQRDIFGQLTRIKLPWFVDDDADYWNELNNSLTRYLEELELTRERVGLVLETEDRRLSVRMNRTMYRFGIITGIFCR